MPIESNNSLESFTGWEDNDPGVDLFSQAEIEVEGVAPAAKKEGEEESPVEIVPKGEEDLFSLATEDNEEENEGEEEEEDEKGNIIPKTSSKISTLNFMVEKGFIEYELEEGEELTEDRAEQLIEDSYESSMEEMVNEKLTSLPESYKNLIKFGLKGGDLNAYLSEMQKSGGSGITSDLDMENEANQELVVRELLRADKEDEETIEAQIDFLKDSKRLKSFSEKKFAKWKEDRGNTESQLLKQKEDSIKADKEALKKSKLEMETFIQNNDKIHGLSFTKEDKKSIPSYMSDRNVKLQNGVTITELQKDLYYELPKNKEALMQLAMLMKNRKEDGTFNFENIETNINTKITKEMRDNIRRNNASPKKSLSTSKARTKSLAEVFN
jgi:hypothetical protein